MNQNKALRIPSQDTVIFLPCALNVKTQPSRAVTMTLPRQPQPNAACFSPFQPVSGHFSLCQAILEQMQPAAPVSGHSSLFQAISVKFGPSWPILAQFGALRPDLAHFHNFAAFWPFWDVFAFFHIFRQRRGKWALEPVPRNFPASPRNFPATSPQLPRTFFQIWPKWTKSCGFCEKCANRGNSERLWCFGAILAVFGQI